MTDEKEFLPASTRVESTLETVGLVSSIVPWIGGPVSSVLGGMSAGRKFSRVREVLIGLTKDLASLKSESSELYVRSEEFEELLENTLRRVADERSEEKRTIYRAFLANAIEFPGEGYDEQLRFLRTLEEMQPDHLRVIVALAQEPDSKHGMMGSPIQTLSQRLANMEENDIEEYVTQLTSFGVVKLGGLHTMMTGSGAQELRGSITAYGTRFLKFLQSC